MRHVEQNGTKDEGGERQGVDGRAVLVEVVGRVDMGAGVLAEHHGILLPGTAEAVEVSGDAMVWAQPYVRHGAEGGHAGKDVVGEVQEGAALPADERAGADDGAGPATDAQGRGSKVE